MQDSSPRELVHASGARRKFLKTGSETAGALLEMEVTYPPHSERPTLHYHPHQAEHFLVLAGRFRVVVAGETQIYGPGETFDVPAAAEHQMENISAEPGRLNWQVRPALRTQDFFTALWQAGESSKTGRPNLLQLAVLLTHYRQEFVPSNPSPLLQKFLFGILAPIGRLLGYRG